MSTNRQDDNSFSKCSGRRSPAVDSIHPSDSGRIGAEMGSGFPGGLPLPAIFQTRSPKVTQPSATPKTASPINTTVHPTPDTHPAVIIGQRLRALRREKGYSQPDVAALVGCDFTTVSTWERGVHHINLDAVSAICSSMNVEIERLTHDLDISLVPLYSHDEHGRRRGPEKSFSTNRQPRTPMGLRIRSLRRGLRLSTITIAQRIGCGRPHFSKLELGTKIPTDDLLSALAHVLCTTPEYLIGTTDDPSAKAGE